MAGKTVNIREKITNRSIGFNFRQIEFFDKYPEFKPDLFCRKAVDEQIAKIDSKFLDKEAEKNEEEEKD